MTVSSRTPEGRPERCVLCGASANLEFSDPAGDAPCPNCGHLLWKSAQLMHDLQTTIRDALALPVDEIDAETLIDDLGADSTAVIELVMRFEDTFGVAIPDDDYERIRTIGDAVRYIQQRLRHEAD